jgi:hypothetical protein
MSNNKITIDQAKQQISEGFSSIMTREDVLHLLDCLEVNTDKSSLTQDQINNLAADIANEIVSAEMNIVDDYDLSMNYKEVEIDGISFDSDKVQDLVSSVIEHFMNQEAE